MDARRRTLAIAAALAAAVVALVATALLGVERPDEAARARHDLDARALAVDPARVTSVSLERAGAAPLRLSRDAAGWRVEGAGAAAPGSVERLVAELAAMRVRGRFPADPGALSSRGLSPAPSRVRVVLADGTTRELEIGDPSPFDRSRFCRRGAEILAVDAVPDAAVTPSADRFLPAPGGG